MASHVRRALLLVATVVGTYAGPVEAGTTTQSYMTPDGTAGGIVGVAHTLDGRGERVGSKAVSPNCHFRVDSVVTGNPNDVLLTVYGYATSTVSSDGASTLSVRPVATEIQCAVFTEAGVKVFDMTRAESGALVPLASQVTIRNDGPYDVCMRADAKYENGDDIEYGWRCVDGRLCCPPCCEEAPLLAVSATEAYRRR